MKNVYLIILAIFINFSSITLSQNFNQSLEIFISNLKEKLLLNDDQVNSIRIILNDFLDKKKNSDIDTTILISNTNDKIESYLDRKQKIKFNVIKENWWKRLITNNIN
jgi:hemerythrin superfamily protein